LVENGENLGISPNQIFLFGQSAGASHVASYLFDKKFNHKNISNISGSILFSGAYDLSIMKSDAVAKYYGEDESLYPKMSSINFVSEECCPLFVVTSEFDPPVFKLQSERLIQKLIENEHKPSHKNLSNHNHLSQVIHLNTDDKSIGPDLIDFINKNK